MNKDKNFTIDKKLNVAGSSQFKVHHSKERTDYATKKETYISIKRE
ncbi:hypothetical protein [Bacillus cereus]